ncbi:competence protein CoiA [Phocicoccus pinnipedialis]|uniref:Competence protein CoiA-like family protein n=1 Tax=Phocicoccus pinnipedialis TaxID=110845 RepID=A0A6V7R7E7_9BACL|nr:competence protein CoiA family protein [Jeotgalicoccus pinnipedialis]MBP1938924.1 competence protein CoiA [Jeotgalicoccus pinnipedialis]CAD2073236.1 Competence protein CoiA-like family protein [Jeotgalicoccus pinnipedialis]
MFIAIDEVGNEIEAIYATRSKKYYCPVCQSEVIVKRGDFKIAHFSHQNINMCERYLYRRESPLHLKLKNDLYVMLKPHYDVRLEYYLHEIEQIPDCLVEYSVALEIQLSKISPSLILERTNGYKKLGIDVRWIHDDSTIVTKADTIFLNHFQISTMNEFHLFTVNSDTQTFFAYRVKGNVGGMRWLYEKEMISHHDLVRPINDIDEFIQMETDFISNEIKRARMMRSVRNKTLTYLYLLQVSADELPVFFRYLTPFERYIQESPLEWKLYLYYHIKNKSFNYHAFLDYITIRKINTNLTSRDIANGLLYDFKSLLRISNE